MRMIEMREGISEMQELRHSTHILRRESRGSCQQFLDKGLGKSRNVDFEPLHYMDT